MDYFEFEGKLGYRVSARPARTTELSQKQSKTSKSDAGSGDPGDTELKGSNDYLGRMAFSVLLSHKVDKKDVNPSTWEA